MNNLEQAVIEAAKAWWAFPAGDDLEEIDVLYAAVSALEAAAPKQRKFWINFHLNSPRGGGEGGVPAFTTGPVTLETLDAWKAGISTANGGASIVIRTWTELEA